MQKDRKESILLAVNPLAGMGKAVDLLGEYLPALAEDGNPVTVYFTQDEDHLERILASEGDRYDRIIVTGGDGSLHQLANLVMDHQIEAKLAYLPLGTTNDFAENLNYPDDIAQVAKLVRLAEPHALDLGKILPDRYFVYVASFGIFTASSYSTPTELKNRVGKLAYFATALKNLGSVEIYPAQVVLDEETHEGDFIFGAILNSCQMGGIVRMDSDSFDLADGMYEVLLVKKPSGPADVTTILNALMNTDFSSDLFIYKKVRSCSLTFDRPVPWTLDGEFGGDLEELSMEVVPHAWKLCF